VAEPDPIQVLSVKILWAGVFSDDKIGPLVVILLFYCEKVARGTKLCICARFVVAIDLVTKADELLDQLLA
jgi:hypothetical protein